jgi:Fe-S-cluster containining protein
VKINRKGEKLIKLGYSACQFLAEDRRCSVYPARPKDCQDYYCWEQEDTTVFDFAQFLHLSPAEVRRWEQEQK